MLFGIRMIPYGSRYLAEAVVAIRRIQEILLVCPYYLSPIFFLVQGTTHENFCSRFCLLRSFNGIRTHIDEFMWSAREIKESKLFHAFEVE